MISDSRLKILIAAGGSGGHIFPAIALAKRLKDKESHIDIKFVASSRYLDKRIFEKESFHFSLLSANKLPYKFTSRICIFFVELAFDIIKAFFIVLSYRPSVVVGFGGYVSWPIIFASYILRIPRITHEQNVVPGRANSLSFKMVDRIAISFVETLKFIGRDAKKAIFTGNPIRTLELKGDRAEGIRKLGLDESKFTLLVIGGSQGSHFLNKTFVNALSLFEPQKMAHLQVIHITGLRDYEWVAGRYEVLRINHRVYSFLDKIEDAYSAADIVVARSGASSLFEMAYLAKPMILIPYPFAMSHQAENALVFSKKGAAIEIDENRLSAEVFRDELSGLLNDRDRLEGLSRRAKELSVPQASDSLADAVLALARRL